MEKDKIGEEPKLKIKIHHTSEIFMGKIMSKFLIKIIWGRDGRGNGSADEVISQLSGI